MKSLTLITLTICLDLAIIFSGCSAAKKVAKQSNDIGVLKAQICPDMDSVKSTTIQAYVLANPCPTQNYNLDSFCKANYTCSSATVYLTDSVPAIKSKSGLKTILVPTPDVRQENILKDTIAAKNLTIVGLQGQIAGANSYYTSQLNAANKTTDFWKLLFFALAIIVGIFIFIKIFFKITWL